MEDKAGLLSESIVYCTALYLAAQNGHRDVVKYISELPIKPIGSEMFKFTAFYFAAQNGNMDVLKYFAQNGDGFADDVASANIEQSSDTDTEPDVSKIFEAAKKGDEKQLIKFIAKGVDINILDEDGNAPLHVASAAGNIHTVKVLLENRADMRAKNTEGNMPIHLAAEKGHTEVIRTFVENGQDIETMNSSDDRLIHLAVRNRHLDLINMLVQYKCKMQITNNDGDMAINLVIGYALENFSIATFNTLFKNGYLDSIEAYRKDDVTCLETAIWNNQICTVKCLLKAGYSRKPKDGGKYPLFIASSLGHVEIAKLLIKIKNNFSVFEESVYLQGTNVRMNPLHIAIYKGHYKMVELLLEYGCNPDEAFRYKNDYKITPLALAEYQGHKQIVKLLLTYKATEEITFPNIYLEIINKSFERISLKHILLNQ